MTSDIIKTGIVCAHKLVQTKAVYNMDVKYFELRAANKDCNEKISEIAKQKYNETPIFEHACNYVNESSSYKRNGRKLEIIEIGDYYLIVKLSSETRLEMASKSLVGFSRELIRVDEQMNPDKDARLFNYFLYNSSLFRNTQVDIKEIDQNDTFEMTDVEALKLCVDLFCGSMTVSKEESAKIVGMKEDVKKILIAYKKYVRR